MERAERAVDVAWASAIAPVLSSRKEYVLILHTGSNRSWWQNFQRAGVCFGVYEYRESTRASEHPEMSDLVATEGGDLLEMSGKVVP